MKIFLFLIFYIISQNYNDIISSLLNIKKNKILNNRTLKKVFIPSSYHKFIKNEKIVNISMYNHKFDKLKKKIKRLNVNSIKANFKDIQMDYVYLININNKIYLNKIRKLIDSRNKNNHNYSDFFIFFKAFTKLHYDFFETIKFNKKYYLWVKKDKDIKILIYEWNNNQKYLKDEINNLENIVN